MPEYGKGMRMGYACSMGGQGRRCDGRGTGSMFDSWLTGSMHCYLIPCTLILDE